MTPLLSWLERVGARLRPRLLARVLLALGAVGLLPLAIVSFGLVDINREAIEEQVLRTHAVAARTAAERIASYLATRTSLVEALAGDAALADPASESAGALLSQSLGSWSDLGALALGLVDPTGREGLRAQLKGIDRARVERALAAPGTDPVAAIADPGGLLLRISVPLPSGAGTLRMICEGTALSEFVQATEVGDEADLVVVAADRRALVGSGAPLSGFPAAMVDGALSGKVGGAGRFRAPTGEKVLGAFAPVPGTRWAVLSRQPARVADAAAYRLRRRAGYAIGAALVLIAALGALAWGSIVRPLRDLVRAQRRLARVEPSARGGDEIADLKNAFSVLERSVSDRERLAEVFLGRYQVVEFLGSGAMGSVFRGFDPKLERAVALKTVRLGELPDATARESQLKTLLREAVTVAQLNHPNIVAVYDVEDVAEAAFIAMEFVDGTSLENLIWKRGRLSPDEVIPLGAALARGLAAAHERGILHRDIKPANLLLGRDDAIKVTDFGIAELASASERGSSIFGTPGYIPPETLRGEGYGARGDLFALGVVLFHCLTGKRPFGGGSVRDIVRATLEQDPVLRPQGETIVPPELERLVLELLARDPEERPASADDVADRLDAMAAERNLRWRWQPRYEPAADADAGPTRPFVSPPRAA